MLINTSRFGAVEILPEDILHFAEGLIGMERRQQWVLLADAKTPALGWLQSVEDGELALAVASPRRFVRDYQVRVGKRDVQPLGVSTADEAQVLCIISKTEHGLALNLKAPLVVCLETRRGRQVVARDDHGVQYHLGSTVPFRQSA